MRNFFYSTEKIFGVPKILTVVVKLLDFEIWGSFAFKAEERRTFTTLDFYMRSKHKYIPILWNHLNRSLLVVCFQFHANPIFCRWRFTLASNSATRWVICGTGVS